MGISFSSIVNRDDGSIIPSELRTSGIYYMFWKGRGGYIGQSVNIHRRISQHISDALNSGIDDSLCNAIRKYGLKDMEIYVFTGPYYGIPEQIFKEFKAKWEPVSESNNLDIAEIFHIMHSELNNRIYASYNISIGGQVAGWRSKTKKKGKGGSEVTRQMSPKEGTAAFQLRDGIIKTLKDVQNEAWSIVTSDKWPKYVEANAHQFPNLVITPSLKETYQDFISREILPFIQGIISAAIQEKLNNPSRKSASNGVYISAKGDSRNSYKNYKNSIKKSMEKFFEERKMFIGKIIDDLLGKDETNEKTQKANLDVHADLSNYANYFANIVLNAVSDVVKRIMRDKDYDRDLTSQKILDGAPIRATLSYDITSTAYNIGWVRQLKAASPDLVNVATPAYLKYSSFVRFVYLYEHTKRDAPILKEKYIFSPRSRRLENENAGYSEDDEGEEFTVAKWITPDNKQYAFAKKVYGDSWDDYLMMKIKHTAEKKGWTFFGDTWGKYYRPMIAWLKDEINEQLIPNALTISEEGQIGGQLISNQTYYGAKFDNMYIIYDDNGSRHIIIKEYMSKIEIY